MRRDRVTSTGITVGVLWLWTSVALATATTSPDVLRRRGTVKLGDGKTAPTVKITSPEGGWTTGRMLKVAGTCSDPTADPLIVNINGSRYYVRANAGAFSRAFPAAMGRNNVSVECTSAGGTGKAERIVTAAISPMRLKVVLTSDTDNVYTDLHIYEPGVGAHVYWAQTESPSGGLFYLNDEGGSYDKPGYGPYLYVHPAPPVGTFRVDANYWPGGVVQHTLANLEIIMDEGLPTENRRRVMKPLAMPGETQTLALITILPNRAPPKIFVPGQDPESLRPADAPKVDSSSGGYGEEGAALSPFLTPGDEANLRDSVTALALSQARRMTAAWDPGQRDCAGLIRFAYREALAPRTATQRHRLGLTPRLKVPPVSDAARATLTPDGLWSTGNGRRGPFADAQTLVTHNFRPVGRDLASAKPGDLLVYRRDTPGGVRYHLMMYAGGARGRDVVVYHNGESGKDAEVRVVSVRDLANAPDADWRPVVDNSRFLGVYQWQRLSPDPAGALAGG